MLRHHRFGMKLDTEHLFLRTVYHIDTAVRFHRDIASFFETKTGKRIILSNFFCCSIRRNDHFFLNPLEWLRELFYLQSEILANSLASETNPQKWSVSSSCENFSETIHLRITDVTDIAWPTTEDEDIFVWFILIIGHDLHMRSE